MMDLIKAKEMVRDIAENRKRWGKMYDTSCYDVNDLMDALTVLSNHLDVVSKDLVPKSELTKANRQLAAAVAREAKAKSKLADAEKLIASLKKTDD